MHACPVLVHIRCTVVPLVCADHTGRHAAASGYACASTACAYDRVSRMNMVDPQHQHWNGYSPVSGCTVSQCTHSQWRMVPYVMVPIMLNCVASNSSCNKQLGV